jgi:hypothetical protein
MRLTLSISFFFFFNCIIAIGQNSSSNKKTVLTSAHEQKAKLEEFTKTDKQLFKVKLYAVDNPVINKTQHWFVQVMDNNNNDVNYGKVHVEGYLKNDKNIKLNYIAPAFAMCNQGKYVIGFVKVKQAGTWVLKIAIESADIKDTVTLEMNVNGEQMAN